MTPFRKLYQEINEALDDDYDEPIDWDDHDAWEDWEDYDEHPEEPGLNPIEIPKGFKP